MSKTLTLKIDEIIHEVVPAPVQFVIGVALLSVTWGGVIDLGIPPILSAAIMLAGVGLLGTSLMPLVMKPLGADDWDELSEMGQMIVLMLITVVLLLLFAVSFVI